MGDAVVVFATFHPVPGKEEALFSALAPLVEHTRQEPGNEYFDLYSSEGDQPSFHLWERYADAAALEEHRASDYYKTYRSKLPDVLASPVEVVVLTPKDVL